MTAIAANHVRIHRHGGPEELVWEQVEVADPGPGEVRLRQVAAGLNFIDVYHRTGLYPQSLPVTLGVEGAGIVKLVGEGVTEFAAGDRVAYAGPLGAYADVRLIAVDRLVRVPDGMALEAAAAAMLKGLTAQMLLRRVYQVKPGDTILVHAAAGGVGLLLCQWAAALGATVIGTVSSDAKAALARAHGCHHPIIVGQEDFVVETLRMTGGEKLPVVYDLVGQDTFLRSLDCLRPRGLMVSFGQASGPVRPDPADPARAERFALPHPPDALHLHRRARRPRSRRGRALRSDPRRQAAASRSTSASPCATPPRRTRHWKAARRWARPFSSSEAVGGGGAGGNRKSSLNI